MRLNAGGCVARVMLQELPGTFSVVARSDSERPGGPRPAWERLGGVLESSRDKSGAGGRSGGGQLG